MGLFSKPRSSCPYCYEKLEKKPTRKIKCPHCKESIFVRSDKLVTEEAAWIIDALKKFGFTEEQFNKTRERLRDKIGVDPEKIHIIIDMCNKKAERMKKNFGELQGLYYEIAIFLNKNNMQAYPHLQLSALALLNSFKEMGVGTVEIVASDSCDVCRMLNGKKYSIDEAKREMPIPQSDCKHILHDKNQGFCRCMYVAV